jgi:ketosteroid isomerase-like protein
MGGIIVRRSLAILPLLAIWLTVPAFAEDPLAGAKKHCESWNALAAAGDAAKMANSYYTENATFIGPTPVAGIIIGRADIEKNYAEGFKNFSKMSATCDHFTVLSESAVVGSGTWMGIPKDSSAAPVKGTWGVTFVQKGGKWLAALDSWNIDLPPPPTKTQ